MHRDGEVMRLWWDFDECDHRSTQWKYLSTFLPPSGFFALPSIQLLNSGVAEYCNKTVRELRVWGENVELEIHRWGKKLSSNSGDVFVKRVRVDCLEYCPLHTKTLLCPSSHTSLVITSLTSHPSSIKSPVNPYCNVVVLSSPKTLVECLRSLQ